VLLLDSSRGFVRREFEDLPAICKAYNSASKASCGDAGRIAEVAAARLQRVINFHPGTTRFCRTAVFSYCSLPDRRQLFRMHDTSMSANRVEKPSAHSCSYLTAACTRAAAPSPKHVEEIYTVAPPANLVA
jgi:hypothetical protein